MSLRDRLLELTAPEVAGTTVRGGPSLPAPQQPPAPRGAPQTRLEAMAAEKREKAESVFDGGFDPLGTVVGGAGRALAFAGKAGVNLYEETAKAMPEWAEKAMLANPFTGVSGALLSGVDEEKSRQDERSLVDKLWRDPKYGYGQVSYDTGNSLIDNTVGFAGDVALDPTSYMTLGSGQVMGKAGRATLAAEAAAKGYTDEAVGRLARYGASHATAEEAADLGLRRQGVYLAGGRIPGTEKLGEVTARGFSNIRANTIGGGTKAAAKIRGARTPERLKGMHEVLARGKTIDGITPVEAALFVAADAVGKRAQGRFAELYGREAMKKLKGLSDEEARTLTAAVERGDFEDVGVRDLLARVREDIDSKTAAELGNLGENFMPHRWTREGRAIWDDETELAAELGRVFNINPLNPSGAFRHRRIKGGVHDVLGKSVDFGDGTIDDINKALTEAFPDAGVTKWLEDDARELIPSYIKDVSQDIGILAHIENMLQQPRLSSMWDSDEIPDEALRVVADTGRVKELRDAARETLARRKADYKGRLKEINRIIRSARTAQRKALKDEVRRLEAALKAAKIEVPQMRQAFADERATLRAEQATIRAARRELDKKMTGLVKALEKADRKLISARAKASRAGKGTYKVVPGELRAAEAAKQSVEQEIAAVQLAQSQIDQIDQKLARMAEDADKMDAYIANHAKLSTTQRAELEEQVAAAEARIAELNTPLDEAGEAVVRDAEGELADWAKKIALTERERGRINYGRGQADDGVAEFVGEEMSDAAAERAALNAESGAMRALAEDEEQAMGEVLEALGLDVSSADVRSAAGVGFYGNKVEYLEGDKWVEVLTMNQLKELMPEGVKLRGYKQMIETLNDMGLETRVAALTDDDIDRRVGELMRGALHRARTNKTLDVKGGAARRAAQREQAAKQMVATDYAVQRAAQRAEVERAQAERARQAALRDAEQVKAEAEAAMAADNKAVGPVRDARANLGAQMDELTAQRVERVGEISSLEDIIRSAEAGADDATEQAIDIKYTPAPRNYKAEHAARKARANQAKTEGQVAEAESVLDAVAARLDEAEAANLRNMDALAETESWKLDDLRATRDELKASTARARKALRKAKKQHPSRRAQIETLEHHLDELDEVVEMAPDSVEMAATARLLDHARRQVEELGRDAGRIDAEQAIVDSWKGVGLKDAAEAAGFTRTLLADGWTRLAATTDEVAEAGVKTTTHELIPKGLEGMVMREQLWTAMTRLEAELKDPKSWRFIDDLNSFFKTYATMTPGFHLRNAMGATFLNFSDGVKLEANKDGFSLWKKYRKGGAEWLEKQDEATRGAFDAVFGAGTGGRYSAVELGVHKARGGKLIDNAATKASAAVGLDHVEGPLRLAVALDTIRNGGSTAMAQARITRLHFDYSEVSNFDRQMKRLIPFWTFASRNLPLQLQQLWTKPKVFSIYDAFVQNFDLSEDGEVMPQHLRESGGFVAARGIMPGGRDLVLNPDLQHVRLQEEIGKLTNPLKFLADATPWARVPLELLANKSMFFDSPITYGQDNVSSADGVNYALRGIAPPIAQAERLLGIGDRYSDRQLQSTLNYLGLPVRQVGEEERARELRRIANS